jgi:hypothetical protein
MRSRIFGTSFPFLFLTASVLARTWRESIPSRIRASSRLSLPLRANEMVRSDNALSARCFGLSSLSRLDHRVILRLFGLLGISLHQLWCILCRCPMAKRSPIQRVACAMAPGTSNTTSQRTTVFPTIAARPGARASRVAAPNPHHSRSLDY